MVNVYCQEKYLILKNIDIKNSSEPLMPSDVHCDVACLVYDSSHTRSFEYVAKVYLVSFHTAYVLVSDQEFAVGKNLLQPYHLLRFRNISTEVTYLC